MILTAFVVLAIPVFAQHIEPVVMEPVIVTEESAPEADAAAPQQGSTVIVAPPASEIVRVGIGDNALKNYNHREVGLFCTREAGGAAAFSPTDMAVKRFTANNAPAVFACESGLMGVEGLKRAGSQALYRGKFEIVRNGDRINLVNVIEVEDYLKGVVPNEMPVRFGLEALKAQSVAARNYVLAPRVKSSPNYDVVDSVAAQVYFGANTEKPLSNQAVEETCGVVALYNSDLILAMYSSTAGGYTENYSNAFLLPQRPYLAARPDILSQTPLNSEEAAAEYYKSKPDAYDIRSPNFRWEREWEADELSAVLKKVTGGAALKELRARKRGDSGKIIDLEIVTTGGVFVVSKELVIRRLLTKDGKALPSANVVFEHEYDDGSVVPSGSAAPAAVKLVRIKAFGGGYGHGVGMSQYGAGFMGSELKRGYEYIIQHYYTGVALGTKPVVLGAAPVTQTFYTREKKAAIIVDGKLSKVFATINGEEYQFEAGGGVLKRHNTVDISKYIKKGTNTVTLRCDDKKRAYIELVKPADGDVW